MKIFKFSSIDDWANPIAVKEMRQAVKGKFISSILILFLMVELIIIGAVLIFHESQVEDFNIGRGVFMGLLGVLLATCLFFLPAYTALRLSAERSDNNVDLFFITSLKPAQIIWGKLSSGLLLTLLFFSAAMPFMTLTYLLRGLDLPSVFILLALDFFVVIIAIQFGILLASAPGNLISRGIRFLIGLAALVITFGFTLGISGDMLFRGIGSSIGSWNFWGPALTIASFILLGTGLFFVLSVTIITPASANRAVGPRIYLFFIWLATGIITAIWSAKSSRGHTDFNDIWLVSMVSLFSITLFFSICERQHFGPRVTRKIPSFFPLRLPAFFLYSGAANGLSYSIIMLVATFLFAEVSGLRFHGQVHQAVITLAMYSFCYALTALLVKRIFFAHSTRTNITALIALFLLVAGSVVPMIIGFMVNDSHRLDRFSPAWFLGNPFVVFWERKIWDDSVMLTSIWGICVLVLTLPWLFKQIRNFKPAPKPVIQEMSTSNE